MLGARAKLCFSIIYNGKAGRSQTRSGTRTRSLDNRCGSATSPQPLPYRILPKPRLISCQESCFLSKSWTKQPLILYTQSTYFSVIHLSEGLRLQEPHLALRNESWRVCLKLILAMRKRMLGKQLVGISQKATPLFQRSIGAFPYGKF